MANPRWRLIGNHDVIYKNVGIRLCRLPQVLIFKRKLPILKFYLETFWHDIPLSRELDVIYQTRETVGVSSGYPNTGKTAGNTTRKGIFLTKFDVFGNRMKHCVECLMIYFQSKRKKQLWRKTENKIVKIYAPGIKNSDTVYNRPFA